MNDSTHDEIQSKILLTELATKQVELKIKEDELRAGGRALRPLRVSPAEATVLVGLLAFLGTFAGTYVQESSKLRLREREQESALILEALKGGSPEQNLDRLRLLIDAGFIADKNSGIKALILSGKYGGAVPAPSSSTFISAIAQKDVPKLMKEVVSAAKLTAEVELRALEDFPAVAAASLDARTRNPILIYDKKRITEFDPQHASGWTVPFVLAHEIGHHALGHFSQRANICPLGDDEQASTPSAPRCKSESEAELEADQFAGKVLRQLGSSLEQAKDAYLALPDDWSLHNVPKREKRIEAIANGWMR